MRHSVDCDLREIGACSNCDDLTGTQSVFGSSEVRSARADNLRAASNASQCEGFLQSEGSNEKRRERSQVTGQRQVPGCWLGSGAVESSSGMISHG
jgi:hypothetical protein